MKKTKKTKKTPTGQVEREKQKKRKNFFILIPLTALFSCRTHCALGPANPVARLVWDISTTSQPSPKIPFHLLTGASNSVKITQSCHSTIAKKLTMLKEV